MVILPIKGRVGHFGKASNSKLAPTLPAQMLTSDTIRNGAGGGFIATLSGFKFKFSEQ